MSLLFPADAPAHKKVKFHPRVLGTPAPMFPGYEIDVGDHVDDTDKPDAIWHRQRAKDIIKAHPEIKDLFGYTSITALWCLTFFVLQVGLAMWASQWSWWHVVLVAYVVGSWIDINLFQLAHDCNHNLVFKKTAWNRRLFTLTTLPMFLSGHHAWWIEHHVHHNDLGARKDFVTRRRTAFLLTRQHCYLWFIRRGPLYRVCCVLFSPIFMPYALFMLVMQALRSCLGLVVYALGLLFRGRIEPGPITLSILADEHLVSGYEKYGLKKWAVVYPVLSFTLTGLLFWIGGWQSVVYLLLAQLFSTGFLHPFNFGIILSNSHFHGQRRYQPSSSLYGWSNWLNFNFGLHTEHHDIMGIPWSRLGKLRQIAPEFYDDLVITKSYSRLAFQFACGDPHSVERQFGAQDHHDSDPLEPQIKETVAQAAN